MNLKDLRWYQETVAFTLNYDKLIPGINQFSDFIIDNLE